MCLWIRSTTKKLRREFRTRLQKTTYLRAYLTARRFFAPLLPVSNSAGQTRLPTFFHYRKVKLVKKEVLQTFFLISMTLTSLIIFKFA